MPKRALSAVLVASLVLAARPAGAEVATTPKSLRGAVESAVAQAEARHAGATLTGSETRELARRAGALRSDPAAGQSAGGGIAKALVVTLLSTAVSVGAYMFLIKKSQEQTASSALR